MSESTTDRRTTGTGSRWGGPLLIDAELRPNRSLGRAGFLALTACVALASFAAGLAFALAGAWPVFGFFGLDAALVWLAFWLNYRGGRAVERLRLSPALCEVERVAPSGHAERWTFQPFWLGVALEAPDEHHCRLTLSSRGTRLVLGAFLAPEERRELYRALRGALDGLRASPRTSRMS